VPAKAALSGIKDRTTGLTAGRHASLLGPKGFLSVLMAPPPPSLDESVATFEVVAGVCTNTPKNTFELGDTVCARATNAPIGFRRFNWSGTQGFIRQSADVVADPDTNLFTLPASNTSIIDGITVDNRGTWAVSLNSISDNTTRTIAYFNVSDPANVAADLVVYNFSTTGDPITAGTNTAFFLWASNTGPDAAANVHLTMAVPPNMSFDSAATSSAFACAESGGVVDCTVATWASGAVATITLNYAVSGAAPDGVISSTANISSDTNDPRPDSNSSVASVEIRSAGAPPATCALGCPADITVTATGPTGAVVNFAGSVEVSGDCGTITYSPASGSTFPIGTNAVSVTSGGGSGGSCSFTVTVIDPGVSPPPTISCPSNQSAVAPSGAGEVAVSTGTPTATGTGVAVSGTRSDNRDVTDPYPIGTTIITWTATDSDQRTASCTQHVVVTSVDSPTITCPADQTFDAGGDCQKTLTTGDIGTPTTGGASGTLSSVRSDGQLLTDPYPAGQTVITWTFTNALGSVSCTQVITITTSGDTTPPVLTIPPDVNVTTPTCSALLDDALGVATATDSCTPAVTVTRTGVPLTPFPNGPIACPTITNPGQRCIENFNFPVGTTVVTYTATDAAGNTATGVQQVTVRETTPPTFTFVPSNVGPFNTGPGATSCGTFVGDATLGTATVSDNCDTTVIRTGVPAGNIFPVGDTTITYTAKADISVQVTQIVTVVDNTPPVVTAPAAVTLYTGTGATSCGVTVTDLNGTLGIGSATDNCPGVGAVTRSGVPAGNVFPLGPTTLMYSATDAHGNTSSANQVVTVVDNTPPIVTPPAAVTLFTGPGATSCGVTVSNLDATLGTGSASDNCAGVGPVTRSGVPTGNVFPVGQTTLTYSATDAHSNTGSATQVITVVDNTPPVITLNGQTPSMWPPNHKYQTFGVTNFVTGVNDNCDGPISVGSVVITKVTSDEIENGNGDGNTLNDIVIAADCKSVQLRSEREGGGNGRVYTIYFSVRDSKGNVGTATAKVVVQHNPGETAVDSGVHYTVLSNCP
jgi:hypothetical protein